MTRKALIQRQLKRCVLYKNYLKKRQFLKKKIQLQNLIKYKIYWHFKLQKLPRNSSKVRLHNRCLISGRPRGTFQFFQLSRHFLREYAHQGLLPGIIKASW
uniref:Small ribosomal subunit protein uS14c n=1 Tax=Codium arabicum TaxID=221038 RepID=A0A386B0M5_CODAR|nr:ribosomal protein S14 [Codium arabicum]AYC65240.1 ribosomal protein S14 [Codium arabicum]